MTQPREEWSLDTRRLGRRVLVYDRVESTNTLAFGLGSSGARDGLAILADEQTAGRGQHGRSWLAAPRASVLLTVLLSPPPELRRPAILTAWAAVAVCSVVREITGLQAHIKWPNDVLLREKKVCGILIEQGYTGNTPVTIAGIGLNVTQTAADFAKAGLPLATSLSQFVCSTQNTYLDTHTVARRLLHQLDQDYDVLSQGDLHTLKGCWNRHLGLLGQRVRAECAESIHRGTLTELGFDRIELHGASPVPLILLPEMVSHLDRDEE
jgi:BirA family biotin operon repressor/biotin-[acetyl-CoA-carboxylase] ligase